MAESATKQLKQSIESAETLYHRLVLLVGSSGSGKTQALREFAQDAGSSVVNVNLALSGELLELTAKQRSLRLPGIFDQILEMPQDSSAAQGLVVLDNTEILFDTALKQDPLRLLQGVSRNRSVVASWNGALVGGKLVYAEPGHPEFRSYDALDLIIVSMEEG